MKNATRRRTIQTAAIVADTLLGVAVIVLLPFAWLLRDGLGPDAVESSGFHAITRCLMTFYTGPSIMALTAVAIGLHWMLGKKTK